MKRLTMFLITYFCLYSKEMDEEVLRMQTDEIVSRARLLDNEIKVRFRASLLCFLSCHHR